jgi:hypothetical protein
MVFFYDRDESEVKIKTIRQLIHHYMSYYYHTQLTSVLAFFRRIGLESYRLYILKGKTLQIGQYNESIITLKGRAITKQQLKQLLTWMTESSSRYIIAARSQHFFTKGQQELVD